MKRLRRPIWLFVIALTAILCFQPTSYVPSSPDNAFVSTSIGDLNTLHAAYERWRDARPGSAPVLTLALTAKGQAVHADRRHAPFGRATLNLADGHLQIDAQRLPEAGPFDVWLIDHTPNPDAISQPPVVKHKIYAGQLHRPDSTLSATLGDALPPRFELDQIVVTQPGRDPQQDGLLSGSSTLFQRMYFNRSQPQPESPAMASTPFRILVPPPAHARGAINDERLTFDGSLSLDALVQAGEEIFFTETFDGNGRTCGTCHPITASFTLGPDDIAALPDDNPLFVAEFVPELADLERPRLMRNFGLILENIDGFQDPAVELVMRSIPHVLSLGLTIGPAPDPTQFPMDFTGWSTDGAPDGGGTLRDFLIGAVRQHYPKTLHRCFADATTDPADDACFGRPVDFRMPTEAELDAMEAFLLALGRPHDPDLSGFRFVNKAANRGRDLFTGKARCNMCHGNGGAINFRGINGAINTGVEAAAEAAARRAAFGIPTDGGRGFNPEGGFDHLVANPDGSFGSGAFNIQPLIEAADTPPFFHNSLVDTIEDAVAFYAGEAFNTSPAAAFLESLGFPRDAEGKIINLDDDEIRQVATLLRVLNALENIRTSRTMLQRGVEAIESDMPGVSIRRLLLRAQADTEDAIQVLAAGRLNKDAQATLKRALEAAEAAADRNQTRDSDPILVSRVMKISDLPLRTAQQLICRDGDAMFCR